MGYRATVVTKQREYGSQVFSDWDKFGDLWNDLDTFIEINVPEASTYMSEGGEYYEVSTRGLKEYIEHLSALPGGDKNEFYTDYTNEEVVSAFKTSIEESTGEYVVWEWF